MEKHDNYRNHKTKVAESFKSRTYPFLHSSILHDLPQV